MNPAVVMQNVITKESVAVMVAVPVTMDGTSNLIVQVILVSIENLSTAHNYKKESIQRIMLHCFGGCHKGIC